MNLVGDEAASVSNATDAHTINASCYMESTDPTAYPSNFQVVRTLGQGAYGVVQLVTIPGNPTADVAVKCARTRKREEIRLALRKEALLQRFLGNHKNVLKYFAMRENGDRFHLFIEFADGGELFDRIEPDVGMPVSSAYCFLRQLLDGLEYIHSKGVVHRDIKPENLLMTSSQVLKIADFGLATIFRRGDNERLLSMQCGTTPYAAPDVFSGRYRGEPVDVWSKGVVSVAMLTGVLPWPKPFEDCEEYQNWVVVNRTTVADLKRRVLP